MFQTDSESPAFEHTCLFALYTYERHVWPPLYIERANT